MATVKLADIIDVEIYQGIEPENNPQQTLFFDSGVVVQDMDLDAKAALEAEQVQMPFWRDLDPSGEPNYPTDGDSVASTVKVVQGLMKGKRVELNNGWAARDLTAGMTMGADPMTHMKNRTSTWWTWQWQKRLVASLLGIYKANILAANAGMDTGFGVTGDMVHDISIDTGPGTAPNFFNNSSFEDARFMMGERVDELNVLLVHPTIRKKMHQNDDIEYFQDSQQSKTIQLYKGHRLITSEDAPVFATTTGGGLRYISTIFGPAAFGYGEAMAKTPVEMWRNPQIGDGGGEDQLWERKVWLLHPYGHTNLNVTNSAGGGLWQNIADLQLAANWKRNFFRKNVPIQFFVTNG